MRCCTLTLLTVGLIVYLGVGGLVYHYLEYDNEVVNQNNYIKSLQGVLVNHTCLTESDLAHIVSIIRVARSQGVSLDMISNTSISEDTLYWDLWNSFLFSTTVATTIGYGHITPVTTKGKLFTIAFAMTSIPLTLVCLAYLGDKFKWLARRINNSKLVRSLSSGGGGERTEGSDEKWKVLKFAVSVSGGMVVFIVLPAAVFTYTEQWDMVTAIYYGFVTLSTIGFGDYVAGLDHTDNHLRRAAKILIIVWILLGLSFLSLAIGLANDWLRALSDQAVQRHEKRLVSPLGRSRSAESDDRQGEPHVTPPATLRQQDTLETSEQL